MFLTLCDVSESYTSLVDLMIQKYNSHFFHKTTKLHVIVISCLGVLQQIYKVQNENRGRSPR